jgi:hypothetical protein
MWQLERARCASKDGAGAAGNDERGSAQPRAEDRRAEDPRAADGKVTFIAFGIFQACNM